MVFPVPRLCVFQSKVYDNQYLQYITEITGLIMCYGDEVMSQYSKFQVEKANTGDNTLVNIRCCFNNKYWVLQSEKDDLIVAAAAKPEEDQSLWNSTLFKPIFVDDDAKTLRFLHVQSKCYVRLADYNGEMFGCLRATWQFPNEDLSDVFTVFNWESLTILPKYVAFKSDNSKYLKADKVRNIIVCDADQIGTDSVMNEVVTNPDGSICLKNISGSSSSYWVYQINGEVPSISVASNNSSGTKFWPVMIDNNVIGLRCIDNNKYLNRTQRVDGRDLSVEELTVSSIARLQVEEPLLSRKMENISFRLEDARIYNESVVMMVHAGAANNSEEDNEYELGFSYTHTESSTWNASVSLTLGFEIDFESGIPLIFEDEIKISGEFQAKYEWGSTTSKSVEKTDTYTVTVPKNKKKKVTMIVSQGTCDVPFSYVQKDTLLNGYEYSSTQNDGVYTGINTSKIQYKTSDE